MAWTELFANWPHALPRILALFPYADAQALERFRGRRTHFVAYLAATHDLTLLEADESVDDLLIRLRRDVQEHALREELPLSA